VAAVSGVALAVDERQPGDKHGGVFDHVLLIFGIRSLFQITICTQKNQHIDLWQVFDSIPRQKSKTKPLRKKLE
jgi:hypothetical protein